MRLTLFRNLFIHLVTVRNHIFIVRKHETALHDIICRHIRKSRILLRLFKPADSLLEVLEVIIDITYSISGRRSKIRRSHLLHLFESGQSFLPLGIFKSTISFLERIFSPLALVQTLHRNEGKLLSSLNIIMSIEQIERMSITDLGNKRRLRILRDEHIHRATISGNLLLHIAKHRITIWI